VRKPPRLPFEELQPYLFDAPRFETPSAGSAQAPIEWRTLFGNDHPVELEVGFGKGLFLITAGESRPDVNFAGVEIVRKYQLFTATRLAKRGFRNVRVACGDANLLLRDRVPPGSLQAIHVYFPDPWWKKRHHKRRLWTADFVALCAGALRHGGVLYSVTDVEDYAAVIAELVAAETRLRLIPPPQPGSPAHDLDYLTNFERKFRKQGRPIFRMSWQRSYTT
jgi:tRNA (guanine-N7-)-methyltransferase